MKKSFDFEVIDSSVSGGKVRITTQSPDRLGDRVLSRGIEVGNYMLNPVVQWGHNYSDPWATIGKTTAIEVGDDYIDATFQLREPASDSDPQHIVKMLWEGGFINSASVGFNPISTGAQRNEYGGYDYVSCELLEWSLVPVPANQEALRLAIKSLPQSLDIEQPAFVLPNETLELLDETISNLKRRFCNGNS